MLVPDYCRGAMRPTPLALALLVACSSQAPMSLVDAGPRDAAAPAADTGPADPCAASDLDGDGFGTDPSCAARDCDDHNLAIHPGAPEACNGLDDDCDVDVDEGLGEGFCGQGACVRSAPYCVAGRPGVCLPGTPTPELCNSVDDDCDGRVDEDIEGDHCGTGTCERFAICMEGSLLPCIAALPGPELCNRADDDCDGVVDNGFRARVVGGSYLALRGFQPSCDGAGERMGPSCNAAIHRTCAQDGCTTSGFGPVENSGDVAVYSCVVGAPAVGVSYASLAAQHPGCDGTAERIGPNCNAAIHRYCASRGKVSGFGPVEVSTSSASVVCLEAPAAAVINTQYSVLVTHHPGCDGATPAARLGPACNAAIHRYCVSQGYTSGFGPVENSGDGASVTCVRP